MADLICYIIALSCFGRIVSSIQIKVIAERENITLSCHAMREDYGFDLSEMALYKLNKTEDRWVYLIATTKYSTTNPTSSEVSATFPIADMKNEFSVFQCHETTDSLSVTGEYIGLTVVAFFGGFGAGACSIAAFSFLRKRLSRKQLLRSTNKSTHRPVIEHTGDTDGDNVRPDEVVQQVDNLPAYESLSHTMADSNYSVALTQTPRAAEVVYYNVSAN